jgi:hypothetical protein
MDAPGNERMIPAMRAADDWVLAAAIRPAANIVQAVTPATRDAQLGTVDTLGATSSAVH